MGAEICTNFLPASAVSSYLPATTSAVTGTPWLSAGTNEITPLSQRLTVNCHAAVHGARRRSAATDQRGCHHNQPAQPLHVLPPDS